METEAARALRTARASGRPDFVTSPTRGESTGLVIPPIRARTDGPRWVLQDDWRWCTPWYTLTVPRGWNSGPGIRPAAAVRRWLNAFQLGVTGPVVHDFVYDHGGEPPHGSCVPPHRFTRREADLLFFRLMRLERVRPWRRWLGYLFTRALGWTHWGVRGSRLRGEGA